MSTPYTWQGWAPGLDTDSLTVARILNDIPPNRQEEIPFRVRLLEHPCSPVAFPGAITLVRHDCVHALLGRGLLSQDEAFVIGFTMGTSGVAPDRRIAIFKWFTRWIYPAPFVFTQDHLAVFDLAYQEGLRVGGKVYEVPLEEMRDVPVGELRQRLGISSAALRDAYRREQGLVPHSVESARLPVEG